MPFSAPGAPACATAEPDGQLRDAAGHPITIPGLWELRFPTGVLNAAPGALYFTAGQNQVGQDGVTKAGRVGQFEAAARYRGAEPGMQAADREHAAPNERRGPNAGMRHREA